MSFNPAIEMDTRTAMLCEMIERCRLAEDPSVPNGLVYEDDLVKVEKVDGRIITSGKPLRVPLFYRKRFP